MAVDIKLRLIATVNQDYIVLIFYVFAALLLIEYPAAKMIKGIGIIYLFSKLLRSLVISERYCRQPANNIYIDACIIGIVEVTLWKKKNQSR